MNREIKTTIALDGEQKFKREIADARKNLANLGTQLTLAAAQFKNDNDAMKLVETRSKTLRDEIAQQENIVKALSGAVKDSSEKYGENSDQVSKWQAEMNRAAAKLENLRHELANNEQGLDKNGKAFQTVVDSADNATGAVDDFAQAMQDANDSSVSIDFMAFDTAFKNIEDGAKRVIEVVKRVAKGAWDSVVDSSNWADDLLTLSTQTGLSVEELQKWSYAANFVDTDVVSMTKGMGELLKKSADGSAESAKLFNTIAVKTRDSKEALRDQKDIFWDTINALHRMSDENRRNALAQKLFGESYKNLLPLITAGKSAWDAYGEEAEKAGLVMDKDKVTQLGDFNDAVHKMEESFKGLQNNINTELAPAMKTIATAVTDIINKFNEWSQSEEGQAALKGLSDAIGAVVKSLTENVNFQDLVNGATTVLTDLGKGIAWAAEHPETVVEGIANAIKVMAGVWTAKTAIDVLSAISSIGKIGSAAFGGAKTLVEKVITLGGSTIKEGITTVLDKIRTLGSGMFGGAKTLVGKVIDLGKATIHETIPNALEKIKALGSGMFGGAKTLVGKVIDLGKATIHDTIPNALEKIKALSGAALTGAKNFLAKLAGTTVTDANATNLGAMADSLGKMNGMSGLGKVSSFLSGLAKVAVPVALVVGLQELYKVSHQLREEAAEKVEAAMKDDGLVQDFRNYQQALKDFGDAAKTYGADDDMYLLAQANVELARYRMMQHEGAESLDAAWNLWHEKNSDKNFFDGMIPDDPSELIHVLEGNIEEASDKAGETGAEESKEIGVQIDNGMAQGIEENADTVIEAAERLAGYVSEAVQTVMMIKSPSKVMERLGEFVSQGFADGISGAAWRVDDAVTRMTGLASAPAIRQPVAVAAVGNGRAAVGAGYGNIQAIIMMDKTVVGEMVAPVVDGALQAQIEAVRR